MLNQTEREYQTAGGIPIYTLPVPHLHSFSLSLYVKGGALFETKENCGISHFIEHLIFRSINRYMDGGLYPTLDRLGLSIEGITYREFLQFSITGAPVHFAQAAKILTYALFPLNLTAEDIRTERSRVVAEIREEGERTSLDFFTDGILYGDHPLARPITGTGSTLSRLTRTRLEAGRKALFSRENIFFYLSGAMPEDAVAILADAAKEIRPETATARDNSVPLPPAYFHRDTTVAVKSSTKTLVRLSFDIDTTRYADAELTLLYDILFGDGEESVFHQALSEKTGMIYGFRGYMELYRNIGSIGVSYEIPPKDLLPSLRLAIDAIRRTKTEAKEALPFVRAPYIDNAAFLFDDASALAFNRAYERFVLGLPYATVADRARAYDEVSGERLSQIASEIFCPENATLTLKGKRTDPTPFREIILTL